jgi:hypothetical protein
LVQAIWKECWQDFSAQTCQKFLVKSPWLICYIITPKNAILICCKHGVIMEHIDPLTLTKQINLYRTWFKNRLPIFESRSV